MSKQLTAAEIREKVKKLQSKLEEKEREEREHIGKEIQDCFKLETWEEIKAKLAELGIPKQS